MNLFHEAKKVLDKDGKVNPLGPYGRQKLTGREISTYFRRNPVKDAELKKAVQVALDLGGADSIARKEISKFYGSKILKSKEVQSALQYANESVDMNENYRVLAKHGMGTETKNSIKVGTEIDYYRADGAKYMGKVIKKSAKGYIVKDDKNGKNYQFTYHDRNAAKKYLKQGDAIDKAKLNLKHTQDMEKLKDQQKREKETMSEEDIDFEKDVELLESLLLNEVQDKEIMAMRKVSKDMQKVLRDYQKIATMGDKELKNTKHNASYKKVLDARDSILTMIGTLQTRQTIEKSMKKESVMDAYKQMHETTLKEEMITYRVKKMQKPEEQKFIRSAKMMGLKITMNKGRDDTLIVMSGTKKKLRDFDSIARGKSSFGDPSTVTHFDEK